MIGKNFFYLLLIMMSSQVDPTIFTSLISYGYLGVLGLQVFGALMTPKSEQEEQDDREENKTPPNYRAVGIAVIFVLTMIVYFGILISPWCKMFFYAQIFSKSPTA